jgi:hypothetical protein
MFPSMRASRLLAVLLREPLAYRVVRGAAGEDGR